MDQTTKPLREDVTVETPVTTKRRSRGWLGWLVFLLLVGGAAYWWWQREPFQAPERGGRRNAGPMSIVPQVVGKGDIDINLNALGTVTSIATVVLRTQISGQLINVAFKEGQEVKKGDLLAEIDPRPYEAALAQAKGQLARDEALLRGAEVDLKRYQGLSAQNAIPRQTLDTQVALVAQYQGTVAADQALVKAAEVNLAFTKILSPIDGRVGLRQIDQGNYVTPGDANGLVVITQLTPISVLFTLPEDNLQAISKRVREGATLPVTALNRGGQRKIAEGTLQTFDSQIDPTTGTIKLRAQFPNEDHVLYPNQFVNIRLLLDTHKGVTIMPAAGIQRGIPGTFVYIVNGDSSTVAVRKVELGATDGERVEVLSGLQPGDRIVVDGADRLRDGAAIRVRAEGDATPPQPGPDRPGRRRQFEGGQPQEGGQQRGGGRQGGGQQQGGGQRPQGGQPQ